MLRDEGLEASFRAGAAHLVLQGRRDPVAVDSDWLLGRDRLRGGTLAPTGQGSHPVAYGVRADWSAAGEYPKMVPGYGKGAPLSALATHVSRSYQPPSCAYPS